jgi:hypothetical protein
MAKPPCNVNGKLAPGGSLDVASKKRGDDEKKGKWSAAGVVRPYVPT